MPDENEGDVFRRTSYRPVYQEPAEPVQKEVNEDTAAQEQDEASVQEEQADIRPESASVQADPELLPENLRSRPLRKVTLGGISPRMAERMRQQAEEEQAEASGEKKPARPSGSGLFSAIGRGAKSIVPKRAAREENREEYEQGETSYAENPEENYEED